MASLQYDRESAFLAEWMERLTRRPRIHCFDRTLTVEFVSSNEGLLELRITRASGKNSLSFAHVGPNKKSVPIEVWEKGILIRRTDGSALGSGIPVAIQNGTAVVVRCGSSDSGVEILIAEGEFGPDEWKALLACLCLQGRFRQALEILKGQMAEDSADSSWLSRFRSFIEGVAAVTKADGYVLRPLPVVRSLDTPVELAPVLEENTPQEFQDAWISGWNYLAQREFGLASKSFSSFHGLRQDEWRLPLEGRLVQHLESLSSVKIPLKEEVALSARFWEEVFHDLSPASSH